MKNEPLVATSGFNR